MRRVKIGSFVEG